MITIYHNPKCRKSREGLQYLQDKGLEYTAVERLADETQYAAGANCSYTGR